MEESEKIRILLSEYTNLTNQLPSRFLGQCQVYAISTSIAVALLGACFAGWISVYSLAELLVFAALPIVFLWYDIDRDIAKVARRLREIEARVNASAGEDLLVWETKWGDGGAKLILQRAAARLLHSN